jgi:hypothetical protein
MKKSVYSPSLTRFRDPSNGSKPHARLGILFDPIQERTVTTQ